MHIFVGETHIFYHFPTGVSFGEPGSLRIENPNDQRQAIRTPPKAAATAPAARVGALLFFGRVGIGRRPGIMLMPKYAQIS